MSRGTEKLSVGRICFVTNDFAGVIRNGGIGTHFSLMSRVLAERGWDVTVLFCGSVDDQQAMEATPAELAARGISFVWLDGQPAPAWLTVPQYGDGMGNLVASQRAFEALERLDSQQRFDIIEFSDWGALGFRSVQAKQAGLAFAETRLAVKLHSTTEWQRRGNLGHRMSPWELQIEYCERYAFEQADLQLSPSQYMIDDTRRVGWHVREDASVASPFPSREKASTPQGAIRELVFFGRLERRKGLHLFLDALDVVPPEMPILFLGRDSLIEGRRATDIIAHRLGQRPYRLLTELDRDAAIAELLHGDRLVVMPSQSETFGFAVAECVANEIPFLAADAGGIPEVVAHEQGRESWLFEPTAVGLRAALERRLGAPEEPQLRLRRSVAAACEPSSWNDAVETTYRDLVGRPVGRPPAAPYATVAVAVTHYNHPEYLPATLASLAAQTRAPDEVFVVDDGSDEEGSRAFDAEAEKYPTWTFFRQENAGPGSARNSCLARASSEFFLPFDSDNIAAPQLIETLVAAVADGRDAATCHMLAFVEDGDIADGRFVFRYAPTGGPRLLAAIENVFGDTCGLFKASSLRAVGGFESQRWSPHEDWETYTKLSFAGYRVDVVPRVLFFYRTEIGGRLSHLSADPAREFWLQRRMIRELLADVELTHDERVALWENLWAAAQPLRELESVQRAHDELAEWAHATLQAAETWRVSQLSSVDQWRETQLAETHEWRQAQLEDLRSFLTQKMDQATARAELAEEELRNTRASQQPARTVRSIARSLLGRGLGEPRAARTVIAGRSVLCRIRSR